MRTRVLVIAVLLVAATRSQPARAQQALALDTTPPTVSITSPASGALVQRTVAITAMASDATGVTSVTFRVDGSIINTDTKAPYTARWNSRDAATGSHTLRAEARDAAGNVGTSTAVTVLIGSAADTTAPAVSITSPAGGAQVSGTVAVTATASDAVGVASVTFRVDGTALGTDTTSPYSVSWVASGVAAGSHTLHAEARDAAGNVGTSPAVTVTVANANQLPTVSMTAPASGSSYVAPATITLAANAADADGSVSRVEFHAGSTLIGSDATAPYTVTWTVSTPGSYALTATAVDNAGGTTTSASVGMTVTSPPKLSKAVFAPSANDGAVIRYVLDVFPSGADPGTASPSASQNLGKPPIVSGECTADISTTLAGLLPGTYVATVTAVGSSQSTRSAPSPPFVIASTTSVTTSAAVPVSDRSAAPAATESNGTLWVTNSSTNMVAAFDATTGDVLAMIPVGLKPTGIAAPPGAGKVYVADEASDTVSVISKTTMTLSATIPLPSPSGRQPHHVSGSPDGRFVYVGERGANVVDVIDTATDQVAARFSTGWPGSTTRAVVPDADGDVLYAVNAGPTSALSTLVALDAYTGRWRWYLPVDGEASDFAISADGRTGIVARHADRRLALIDLERRAVVNDVDFGAGSGGVSLRLSVNGHHLVVSVAETPMRLGVVDLGGVATLRTVSPGGRTTRSALPAGQLAYVCVSDGSPFSPGVIALDAASHTVVNRFRFPGGGSPYSVVFDP